jgi:hypothetical protein
LFIYFKHLAGSNNDFSQVDPDEYPHEYENLNMELNTMCNKLDLDVTPGDVLKAIQQLKTSKSAGLDFVLYCFIYGKDVLCGHLAMLFGHLIKTGIFPKCWTEGLIVPIHKMTALMTCRAIDILH